MLISCQLQVQIIKITSLNAGNYGRLSVRIPYNKNNNPFLGFLVFSPLVDLGTSVSYEMKITSLDDK